MPAHWITLQVILVLFLATLVRSAFGFGEALISVPLLAFVMPIEVAAPTAVLVSITVALVIVIQDWRRVHVGSAGWLVASTFLGIPVGLLTLKDAGGNSGRGDSRRGGSGFLPARPGSQAQLMN